jgi:uncharacterized protein YbaR (Trm112 family)
VNQEIKEAVMALFKPTAEVIEPDLPVAPATVIEIIICPHCDGDNCEVWDSTEARMATCPDCGAAFNPPVLESNARSVIMEINERRHRFRRRVVNSDVIKSNAVKAEVDRIFSR